ncbi:PREDICTED: sterol O-acyltransferase 2 [Nanorana parkeri]|uniref:sterol O-acyltransferase 2 n=1 Tax=Nanorana parkeri TaxID=125878 RepID=UPI000853FBB8|nr:PREDICTED: sterol O-acyltransferase 2 [Nanorana parkeri]
MAATEDTSCTVRNRKSDHNKDQTYTEQNGENDVHPSPGKCNLNITGGFSFHTVAGGGQAWWYYWGPAARTRKRQSAPNDVRKEDGGVSDHIDGSIEWKRHMEGVKEEILQVVNNHLRILLDKAMTEAVQSYRNGDKAQTCVKKKRSQESVSERRKVFVHRASLLDDLMEVEHFRTIYHMFVAALCVFVISTAAVDIIEQGRVGYEFNLLFYSFGQPGTVAWSWICMFVYTLLVPYKALVFWGSLYPKSKHKRLLSAFVGIFLLVSHICVLCIFPVYVVKRYQLPPASSFIVIFEQVRLLMKSHSFLREAAPAVLQKEEKEVQLPKHSSYLYFLFCPTLIYRDSYPRTPYIRWKYVFKYFLQFLGCIFFVYYVVVTLCTPVFTNMSKLPFSTKTLVLSVFHATLPGILILLLSFFGLLHCWLNTFAEILRFADRMFYKDWWNSTSFSNYYRTWNVVIHDWLFYYVYQDLLWLLNQKFRSGAMLAVFLISAAVHEYALTMALGYFYPVMFCLFAILGVLFNFAINDKRTNPMYNIIVWTFLIIGQGIQVCLYSQEWYARIHCPVTEKTFWGLVTPRSWYCNL